MPGYDQTGPQGDGPLSGRGQGRCSARFDRAQGEPGDYVQSRGRRQGCGFRCGMRNRSGRRDSDRYRTRPFEGGRKNQ